jgi:hypothetical protein
VFETHHLDVEGGVGERRTIVSAGDASREKKATTSTSQSPSRGGAAMEVELEGESDIAAATAAAAERILTESLTKRKKKVTFGVERPELYDF